MRGLPESAMSQSLLQSISLCMDSNSHPTCETETRRSQNGSSQPSLPLCLDERRKRDEGNWALLDLGSVSLCQPWMLLGVAGLDIANI